jgi:hypothetical protein
VPEGHGLADWRSYLSVDLWLDRLGGVWPSRTEILRVWVPGLAGLRGAGLQNGYFASLCRTGGHGPVEQRSCVCVPQAWQALGMWPGRAEIVQACAGLGGMDQ